MKNFFNTSLIISLFFINTFFVQSQNSITSILKKEINKDAHIVDKANNNVNILRIEDINKKGILYKDAYHNYLRLLSWHMIDIEQLKKNDPVIYKKFQSLWNQENTQETKKQNLDKTVNKYLITGINGRKVIIDGILKANNKSITVEVEEGYGTEDIPWYMINTDFLKIDHPELFKVYEKLTRYPSRTNEITLKLGSSKNMKKVRKFNFSKSSGFEKLDNVRWQVSSGNDGDSFLVKHKGKDYVFRLYHVDTTETSNSYPDRVAAQAKYFNTSTAKCFEIANKATQLTKKLLKNKPFTVFTKWENARGNSRLGRSYAFILCPDGRFLSEHLAEKGLVRIYGMPSKTPDGKSSSSWSSYLKKLEASAKKKKLGGWN